MWVLLNMNPRGCIYLFLCRTVVARQGAFVISALGMLTLHEARAQYVAERHMLAIVVANVPFSSLLPPLFLAASAACSPIALHRSKYTVEDARLGYRA